MTSVLHADLDAFYASVEQRDNPRLRGRPMAVGGGVILAASYEARRFGVRTAMNEGEARRRCPQIEIVGARMKAYSEASKAVFAIFDDTTPGVEPLSIDEAFLDVGGLARLVGPAAMIAATLRARVASEVGIPLSVGGASTKFLAKVASQEAKPDGQLIVPDGGEEAFLHPLPVSRLWGVGAVTAERLHAKGLHTVGDVADVAPELLTSLVGRAASHHLHSLAHNRDPRPVETGRRRKSIGSQRSFRAGSVDRAGAEAILLDVCDRISRRLRTGDRQARTVTLRLRFADFSSATRARRFTQPSTSTADVVDAARDLLHEAWPMIEERGLTKVGVALSDLIADDAVQLVLPLSARRDPSLDAAVDQVRERFGTEAVTRSTIVGFDRREVPLLPD
ncbi:MAG: DNA polymerase IV [Actinomycetota bacterium]